MLQGLFHSATRLVDDLHRRVVDPHSGTSRSVGVSPSPPLRTLERIVLTDGVGRTLFEGYAQHRQEDCGQEETGWVLLGYREPTQAVAMAALPAGALRDASQSHVQFNAEAQAVASRVIRRKDRRLTTLGVVHTHPGSLRHPSAGDLRGDRLWVSHLRGQEGVFGIGTADGPRGSTAIARQPEPNVQCLGELRFSWYTLRGGENQYRPLPLTLTLGPDLACRLHSVWSILESQARPLDNLFRRLVGLEAEAWGSSLVLTLPLERSESLRVVLTAEGARYYLEQGTKLLELAHQEEVLDRSVFLLLAELIART